MSESSEYEHDVFSFLSTSKRRVLELAVLTKFDYIFNRAWMHLPQSKSMQK